MNFFAQAITIKQTLHSDYSTNDKCLEGYSPTIIRLDRYYILFCSVCKGNKSRYKGMYKSAGGCQG
jgi:hypothetical protein